MPNKKGGPAVHTGPTYDVIVVGAGVFGAWIALALQRDGRKVAVLDAHGPANSRSSSGGESRIIRMGYGADEIYTRWSIRSLELWKRFTRDSFDTLLHQTGLLWLSREDDPRIASTLASLRSFAVNHRRLSRAELLTQYPQMSLEGIDWGLLEPDSGVLMARRAVQAVLREAVRLGAVYRQTRVEPPDTSKPISALMTASGERFQATRYVFACGAWLPTLFPATLGDRIHPTRQEVFFFGPPAGDARFSSSRLPAWIDFEDGVYGVPDIEHRGFKIAFDRHGPAFNPETDDRTPSSESLEAIRTLLARRFPAMARAPLLEARVCQYENTSSGDFLIDRHPQFANIWFVGGGSGHGFKHGPAVGEYVAARLAGNTPAEPRFALGTKETEKKRTIY